MSQAEQSITLSEKDLNKFGSSVKVIDGQAESHYKMALHFQRRKKHKLAIEELKKAVQLNPLFAKAYNAMGVSYDNLRRYSQAIRCYQSALKLDPKLDYVHNNLGYSYLLKNELDAAIVAFQKAIEINDNNKRYRNNLGLAYVMKGQYDEAYAQFKIVESETRAKEKLARLLDKLGKEKPDQYFAKDSNSGRTREKSEDKKQAVVRLKINGPIPQKKAAI
ncbi:MAG: tetratricopeptide repeat protein, partial [Desulfobacterales bacterium]|nr:tetratricopeptide repeat protein [Desulfobacterales bacterium]